MTSQLTKEARGALVWAIENGVIDPGQQTEKSIIETVEDQEIVSFCTAKGTVTFDIHDVIYS
jgi:hypothetical protein